MTSSATQITRGNFTEIHRKAETLTHNAKPSVGAGRGDVSTTSASCWSTSWRRGRTIPATPQIDACITSQFDGAGGVDAAAGQHRQRRGRDGRPPGNLSPQPEHAARFGRRCCSRQAKFLRQAWRSPAERSVISHYWGTSQLLAGRIPPPISHPSLSRTSENSFKGASRSARMAAMGMA